MLDTSPLNGFIASRHSKISKRETSVTFQETLANTIATNAAKARDRINRRSPGKDKDALQNALIDMWSEIYGWLDSGLAATAIENLKKLDNTPGIKAEQRGAEIALFLRLHCSQKHIGALLGVLVAMEALTEEQL